MSDSPRPVRVGVQIAPQHASYEELRSIVLELEAIDVDVVFNWDHFFPLFGEPDGLHFESWTMLASIAEATDRIEFGPLVNCNSYRNPDLQADMARTIDHISAKGGTGRFIFGTGSGWFERDYEEYGYDFGTAGARLDALAVDLPRIRRRLDRLNPAPTRRIPILIGGGGEKKTLRTVAEHADIWHSFSDPETLEHKLGVLRDHCSAVGTDPGHIEISVSASASAPGELDEQTMAEHRSLGASLFILGISAPEADLVSAQALVDWRNSVNG